MFFRNNIVFFFAICLLILSGLVFFFLGQKESGKALVPALQEEKGAEKIPGAGAGATTIVDDLPETGAVVYENGNFSPKNIQLKGGENGCLISVQNKTSLPLLLRLSPHDPYDRHGAQYPEISPGQSILIDPRFRIPAIAFHNHKNPAEEFSVDLGEMCGFK